MKRGLFLFILIIQNVILYGQSFYCKTIGIQDGLSQSSITCVTYDREGSMWIGTRYGLNEYRGGNIRIFKDGGENHLDGNHVNFLYLDTRGRLWCSTESGLSLYNEDTDEFTTANHMIVLSAIEEDGAILFGTDHGLVRYDYDDGSFSDLGATAPSYIIDIYHYKGRTLIVDRGLGVFIDSMLNQMDIPELREKVIMDSVLDGDFLYLALFKEGLYIVNLNDGSIEVMDSTNSGLSFEVTLSLMLEEDKVWIGTDGGGIFLLEKESRKVSGFPDHFMHHTGLLPDNSVTTIYKDPHGNVWTGSVRNGIFGFKPTQIKSFSASGVLKRHNLSHNVINSVCEDRDGTIWIGTDGGGVNRYDPQTGDIEWIHTTAQDKISSIAEYDSGRLVISVYSEGYSLLDKKTGKKTPITIIDEQTNAAECFTGNSPMTYYVSDSQILFLAINVYLYDKNQGQFRLISNAGRQPVAELNVIGNDGAGMIYAMSTEGIFKIDTKKYEVNCILEEKMINTAAYHDNQVWIGTDSGLRRMELTSGTISKLESPLFTRVTQLCPGKDGGLWIAADNTLFHYKDKRFELFGENAGFATNEILCSLQSKDEKTVFFGGTKGMVEIQDTEREMKDSGKNIRLHEVNVKGKRVNPRKKTLVLPYNFSTLSISVNLNGTDPFDKTIYRYVINGSNSSAIETYENNIQLHSLKAGKYDVSASYLQNDGFWSKPEPLISFRVNNPWYKSMLFQSLVFFFAALLVITLVSLWYRKKVEALEADLQAKDMGFTTKLNSFIEENISNPDLDVPMLANSLAMSRAALYTKVKATTGRPVAQYIEDRRMEHARELLQDSTLSITEISEKVGFSSPKYFSTRFKACNGLSPNAYRKQNN